MTLKYASAFNLMIETSQGTLASSSFLVPLQSTNFNEVKVVEKFDVEITELT